MASPQSIDFWSHIENYSPTYVRLLAKKPGCGPGDYALSDADLSIVSGIPIARIREISRLEDWGDVKMGEMRAFFEACNFDPTCTKDRKRVVNYARNTSQVFSYLQRSPHWPTEFLPLVRLLQSRRDALEPIRRSA